MGFFSKKWDVEFEGSKGFLSSIKKQVIVVEANGESEAKRVAKSILNNDYSYIKILSVREHGSQKVNNAYTPNVKVSDVNCPQKEMTPEEKKKHREDALFQQKLNEYEMLQWRINKQERYIKRLPNSWIKTVVIGVILSLVAFLIGWTPYWVFKGFENASRTSLNDWIELGHSENDSFALELKADAARYAETADSLIWIPFVALVIAIVLTILLVILYKNNIPRKTEEAEQKLQALKNAANKVMLSLGEK